VLYIHCSDDMLWNGSKQNGSVRRERVRKMKVLTVKMETETQSDKGKWNQT
jgi:hypothetical protein